MVPVILAAAQVAAAASPRLAIDIPAGRLGDALVRVAQQANITIGISDPAVAALPVRALRGRMRAIVALRRLTAPLPVNLEEIGPSLWHVTAARARHVVIAHAKVEHPKQGASSDGEVVVTAALTGVTLSRYAGTAGLVHGDELSVGQQARGSDALLERLPTLSSTHLGSGRNKLFIRGVADSSFNGPSQALVGQYLGDLRLNYNAPDPDISLYDVQAVEVVEGPQGTLYGAGALGGVVRVLPNPVELNAREGEFSIGRSFTARGAPGLDGVGIINMPIASGIAVRLLAFQSTEGGYISDTTRKLNDVNRVNKHGGRASARFDLSAWRVELGAAMQNISSRDGQYAEGGAPPLTRSSHTAQPFDNDYVLGSITVSRSWGATQLTSASGFVRQDVDARYDFTPPDQLSPRIFDQRNRISLLSNESRLSHRDAEGAGWVIGMSIIHDQEQLTRALGDPLTPTRILGVENDLLDGAIFGELGLRLAPALVATGGIRFEYTHLGGRPLDQPEVPGEPHRKEHTIVPSGSLSWRPASEWLMFARYQKGFRPGGLSIGSGDSSGAIQRFHQDSLTSIEAGTKWRDKGDAHLGATFTVSHSHWEDIQADLVDSAGLPFTQNIGTGRIWGAEGTVDWRPLQWLTVSGGAFANDSRLTHPAAQLASDRTYELPNVAHLGASGRLAYGDSIGEWHIDGDITGRYVAHSRLGVGSTLDIVQGDYALVNATLRLGRGRWGISLDGTNLLNSRGNMFAFGNPFSVAQGLQRVPPRPRTVRLGFEVHL